MQLSMTRSGLAECAGTLQPAPVIMSHPRASGHWAFLAKSYDLVVLGNRNAAVFVLQDAEALREGPKRHTS